MPQHRRSGEGEPLSATVLKGGALLTVLVGLFLIGITAGRGLPGTSHYELRAQFDDAGNLARTADVRMFGKRIGQVHDLRLEDGTAFVELHLDDDIEPLSADTSLRVRSRSLLSDRYVEVIPGRSSRRLKDGDTIPQRQTSASVEFADFLEGFDAPARAGLRTFFDTFGEGMAGRGIGLNSTLRETPPLLRDTHRVAKTVLDREGAAARFFPSLESAVAAATPAREDIARGFDPEARSLRPFAEHRTAVQALLEEAAHSLPATRSALAQSDPLLRETARFARSAKALLEPAPAAFRASTALLRDSHEPLRRTRSTLRAAAAATPAVLALTRTIDPVVPRGRTSLQDSVPWLRTVIAHACDIVQYAAKFRSWTAFGSPGGDPAVGGWINVARLKYVRAGVESVGGQGPDAPVRERNVARDPYPVPCRGLPRSARR